MSSLGIYKYYNLKKGGTDYNLDTFSLEKQITPNIF